MNLVDYLSAPGAMSISQLVDAKVAKNVGVISQWRSQWQGRRPSPENAAAMEAVTAKHAQEAGLDPATKVTCEELRPDINWTRIPDPEWPWHPGGRPVQEVVKDAVTG
jgi:DNA-binding transcriptional regulator YdaS (Cro superfamily)